MVDAPGESGCDHGHGTIGDHHRGVFDVVLNIGTTEHVLNQFNCFEVIHDATKVNGCIVHQLPVSGFTDHGYFTYTGRFFFEMARFNKYEISAFWLEGPAGNDDILTSIRSYGDSFSILKQPHGSVPVPNCGFTVILRKTQAKPFAACVDLSTSVGTILENVIVEYRSTILSKLLAMVGLKRLVRYLTRLKDRR